MQFMNMQIKNYLNLWVKIPWWIVKADLGRLIYVYLNGSFILTLRLSCQKRNFYHEVGEHGFVY